MIFNTNLNNEFTLFGDTLKDIKLTMDELQKASITSDKPDGISNLSAFIKAISGVKAELKPLVEEESIGYFNQFTKATEEGKESTIDFLNKMKDTDKGIYEYLQTVKDGKPTFDEYVEFCEKTNEANKKVTLSAKAGQVALKGLAMVANMALTALATWAVTSIVKAIDNYIHRVENAKEALKEFNSAFEEQRKSIQSHSELIDEVADKYDELAKHVDTASNLNLGLDESQYKEFINISNDLAEAFPNLVKSYDEKGNAILDFGNDCDTAREKLEQLLEKEQEANNMQILASLPEYYKNASTLINEYEKDIDVNTNKVESLTKALELLNNLSIDGEGLSRSISLSGLDKDETILMTNKIQEAVSEFLKEIPQSQKQIMGIFSSSDIYSYNALNEEVWLNTVGLSEEQRASLVTKVQESTKELASKIKDELRSSQLTLEDAKQGRTDTWRNYLMQVSEGMKVTGNYMELSESSQKLAQHLVQNLDISIEKELKENDPYEYIRDHIIGVLVDLQSSEYSDEVNKLMTEYLTMDLSTLSVTGQIEARQKLIEAIKELIPDEETEQKVIIALGLDIKTETEKEYENLVKKVEEKFGKNEKLQLNSGINKYSVTSAEDLARLGGYIEKVDNLTEAFELYSQEVGKAKEITEDFVEETPKWSFTESIKQLDEAKDKLSTLDEIYAKLFDLPKDGTNIGIDDYSSLLETFSGIEGIDIESHLKAFESAGQDVNKVKSAVESLIGEYLEYSKILDNVTEENKNLVQTMLEEIGVINAEEIVLAALNGQFSGLSIEKEFLSEVTTALTENTLLELDALLQEMDVSEDAQIALNQLALEKVHVNNVTIDTSADIANIIALAEAAHASSAAIAKLEKAKAIISGVEAMKSGMASGVKIDMKEYKEALALMESVENGTFDYGYKKIDPSKYLPEIARPKTEVKYDPSKKEGTATNKALKQSAEDIKDAFEETFDFFEERVKKLDDAIELLGTNLENVTGSFAKNNLIDAQIGITSEKINNYTDAMAMYTQKANEALSKLPSDIQAKIKDGAVDLTTFIGEGNEEVVEAINEYSSWADKVADCKQELAGLKEAIRDLELEKFNNIMEDFSNQFNLHEDGKTLIDKQIGLLKEAGQLIGESFYAVQIDQTKKQLAILEEEKKKLSEQMTSAVTSGRVEIGTDEWIEMVSSLSDVEGSILDAKTALEEFDNALLELHTEVFNRIQEEFSNLNSELENLVGLFEEDKVSDGYGNWTTEALTQLGLLAQQYELAKYQVEQYNNEIDLLNKQYLDGRWSATEYADRLAELSSAQWDAVNSSEQIKDAIIDLNETRIEESIETIEKEIEKYRELIDAQIEALKAAKDLHDYKESIAEKNKSINDLERQIAAMENDTSASTIAKKKLLEEQLAEAKKDLEKTEYDHSIEMQEEALNKEFERYEKKRQDEIEALRKSLEEKELLIYQSFQNVKENATIIGQEIENMANYHGINISNAITNSWKNGENAIASYGTLLSSATSSFIGQLMGVENEVYALQNQANVTADSLAWMFATRADNLVGQLTSSYYSEQNLNAMTNALRDSLINTLERGYNISSITSAFDSIASAANKAASAANAASAAIHSLNSQSVSVPETTTTTTRVTGVAGGGPKKLMMYYAKGTRNAKGGLSVTDEEGYELKLSKLNNGKYTLLGEGDQVFTKEQTDQLYALSKSKIATPTSTKTVPNAQVTPSTASSIQVGNLINVEGSVDSSNIKEMETIAKKAVDRLINKMSDGIKYRSV